MYSTDYKFPSDVQVEVAGMKFTVKKGGKSNSRTFSAKHVKISKEGDTIKISTDSPRKSDKAEVGTIAGHIKNMCEGMKNGVRYRLKAVYAHFPMSIKAESGFFIVNNFLGEKFPRKMKAMPGVDVKIAGQELTLTGVDRETVGLYAAQIEQLCRVTGRDRRVFQDGIYIIEKDGKPLK